MKILISSTRETWKSPDGKITKYAVLGTVDGQIVEYQTFSEPVGTATSGTELDVQVKDKVNSRGVVEKMLTMTPKEYSGNRGGFTTVSEKEKYPSFALSYAKDIVVAQISAGEFKPKLVVETTTRVLEIADQLLRWLTNQEKPQSVPEVAKEVFDEEPPF